MPRTTSLAVQGVLMDEYGPREDDSNPSLDPFIATATVLVDRVSDYADANSLTVTAAALEVLERWLAAHFFKCSDRPASFTSAGKSQTTFDGKTDMHLQSTLYGQTAVLLDSTGYLASISDTATSGGRTTIGVYWGGKRFSQRTPYDQRS
jgi:hypothetical protein